MPCCANWRRESGESEYTRPRMLAQFRGTLEDDPDDDSLPERPTEAELDALEGEVPDGDAYDHVGTGASNGVSGVANGGWDGRLR